MEHKTFIGTYFPVNCGAPKSVTCSMWGEWFFYIKTPPNRLIEN